MFVPHVQVQTRKPVGQREKAGGGVIRDSVKDAEEQSGLPATVEPSAHEMLISFISAFHLATLF